MVSVGYIFLHCFACLNDLSFLQANELLYIRDAQLNRPVNELHIKAPIQENRDSLVSCKYRYSVVHGKKRYTCTRIFVNGMNHSVPYLVIN